MTAEIPAAKFTLADTGTSDGYVNITDNTGAYPGSIGYLCLSDGSSGQRVMITELKGDDSVGIRFLPEGVEDPKLRSGVVKHPNHGRSDCSAYTSGSLLNMPAQDVRVRQPIFDPMLSI